MEYALDLSTSPIWITITFWLFVFFSFLGLIGFVGFRWKDGLWGAILVSFNMVFATLIALNYYESLGRTVAQSLPVGLFYWDSLVFILMLLITFGILNMITNRLSRVIVGFPKPVEYVAMPILLLATCVFVIGGATFYIVQIGATAPKPVAGRVDIDNKGMTLDDGVRWAAKTASRGSLSTLSGPTEFDPDNDFLLRHYDRRCALFEELWKTRNSRFSGKAEFLDK